VDVKTFQVVESKDHLAFDLISNAAGDKTKEVTGNYRNVCSNKNLGTAEPRGYSI
jgi:hypothetical protein